MTTTLRRLAAAFPVVTLTGPRQSSMTTLVRQVLRVLDLGRFQRFVRMCAGRVGQRLNLTTLANEAGVVGVSDVTA